MMVLLEQQRRFLVMSRLGLKGRWQGRRRSHAGRHAHAILAGTQFLPERLVLGTMRRVHRRQVAQIVVVIFEGHCRWLAAPRLPARSIPGEVRQRAARDARLRVRIEFRRRFAAPQEVPDTPAESAPMPG
jgi:hypothetical protein